MRTVEEDLANARAAFGAVIDAYRAVAATLVRVRAIVDEYGDDFEPEDGWRYTRDLLAALDQNGTDEPPE